MRLPTSRSRPSNRCSTTISPRRRSPQADADPGVDLAASSLAHVGNRQTELESPSISSATRHTVRRNGAVVVYGYGAYEFSLPPWSSVAVSRCSYAASPSPSSIRVGAGARSVVVSDGKLLNKRQTFTTPWPPATPSSPRGSPTAHAWRSAAAAPAGLLRSIVTMRPEPFRAAVARRPSSTWSPR